MNLTGNEWQNQPTVTVTDPEAPYILGLHYFRRGYFKESKRLVICWSFGIDSLETEEMRQLNSLPGLSEDPSAVGLLRAEELQVTNYYHNCYS